MEETQEWPGEWLRGVLVQAVLRVLTDGPTYGYAIAARLDEAGLGEIKGGTLYPLLRRLEEAGDVSIEWRPGEGGPGRKYYEITADGRRRLEELLPRWQRFSSVMARLLAEAPTAGGAPHEP